MKLKDQVALITGGTSGIGKAIAARFLKEGAKVHIVGSNAERGAAAVDELPQSVFHQADVSDFARAVEVVSSVVEADGKLTILVNNAGIVRDGLFMRMKEEDWDRVISVNLKSCFNYCQAATRQLQKAKGSLINVASVVGITGAVGQANYAASKAGIIGLTTSLAQELRGVNVNCIAPGFIRTPMTDALSDELLEDSIQKTSLKRLGEPEDIADVALLLAQKSYITGQTIRVDGGIK